MNIALDTDSPGLLSTFLERHVDYPHAEFVLDARGSRVFRYGELLELVSCRRRQFDAWHLQPGQRIGVRVSDPLEFVSWFLAALHAGLWLAPLDPTPSPTYTLTTEQRVQSLRLSAVISDVVPDSLVKVPWLDAKSNLVGSGTLEAEVDGGGVVLASSGTTGTPKVMALKKRQLLTNARFIAENHELTRDDRGFNSLPLWHINAEVVGVLASLYAGSSLVLDERFHRTGFWKVVSDWDVTWINAVPAIIARLVTLQEGESIPARLRFVRSASAPLSPSLMRDFEALAGVAIIESYGMTEAGSQICANSLGAARKPGSVGRPIGVEVRVKSLGNSEHVGRHGEVGPVEIKGPTVITAYDSVDYGDRFDEAGWLRTGDLGYFDDEGYLFLVGRSDDVINRGGEKIYPQEIENVLSSIEVLERVVVIGEPHEVFGQVPVAYLEFSPSFAQRADRLDEGLAMVRAALLDGLSRTSRPAQLKVVETIPTHPTGKVRKALVRDGDVTVVRVESL